MAFRAGKQCKSWTQSRLSVRSMASSTRNGIGMKSLLPADPGTRIVIGMIGGLVGVACCIGAHTAKQHLFHSPSVQVTKKKRGTVPEVDHSDAVIQSANKFVDKSFLRKVGHIQDDHNNPNVPNIYTRSRESETLKTTGVST